MDHRSTVQPVTGIRERLGMAGGRSDAAIRHYNRVLSRMPRSRGLVVFESMVGAQYSDSPRAIYEELRRRGLADGAVWSVARDAIGFPADVPTVRRWTPDWYRALARAQAWVTNQGFPAGLSKPSGTTFVQTWHGTPLKKMGRDDPAKASDPVALSAMRAASSLWDVVPVPSDYFVETIVDAFESPASVLRCGSPRNDVLLAPQSSSERAAFLSSLGLPADRVALYAPTRKGRLAAPLVSPGFWSSCAMPVMQRLHYTDVREAAWDPSPSVVDVSSVPDMASLLRVADVLITDFSSSLFDFCLTDRPIILFQPDQSTYLAERGLIYDIREFAPGPVVTTEAELRSLLGSVSSWSDDFAAARAAYRARFCTYETGTASAVVVDEVLAPLLR